MTQKLFIAIVSFFLLFSGEGPCEQNKPLILQSLHDEVALSQNSVYDIFQDSRGFLWFGTEDGLNRYDGFELHVYPAGPRGKGCLESGWISAIQEDRKGKLLIGTVNGGLSVLDWETEGIVTHRHHPDRKESLSHDRINCITLTDQGAIWLGTGSGVDRWLPETQRFVHYPIGETESIFSNRHGTLYAGGRNGLFVFRGDGERFAPLLPGKTEKQNGLGSPVTCITEDQSGHLWMGTRKDGLFLINEQNGQILKQLRRSDSAGGLSSDYISGLILKKPNQLWVATRNAGLNIIDLASGVVHRFHHDNQDESTLINDGLNCLYSDESGLIWMGTDLGVSMYDPQKTVFWHILKRSDLKGSKDSNMVWAILKPSGAREHILIGTDRGLRWSHYPSFGKGPPTSPRPIPVSLDHRRIFSLTEHRDGSIWIGTNEGLTRWWPEMDKTEDFRYQPNGKGSIGPGIVSDIVADRDGNVWAGTFSGSLFRINIQNGLCDRRLDRSASNDMAINHLLFTQDWQLIAGTNRGLAMISQLPQEKDFGFIEMTRMEGPLGDQSVSCLMEDRFGLIWIGTARGLYQWNRNQNRLRHFTRSEGLPNNFISGILEEPDRKGQPAAIWISTNLGLSRFDLNSEEFTNFDSQDGLQANEFNGSACFRSGNGELFFGGINGITAFNPWEIRKKGLPSKLAITGIFVYDRPAAIGREIHSAPSSARDIFLTYRDAYISVKASVMDFRAPGKNRISYLIDGITDNWVDLGKERIIRYPGLSPGTYRLVIRGFNSQGLPSVTDRTLLIHVSPPLWQTWWAYTVYIILFLFLLMSLHWIRIANLKKRKEELAEQVRIRTLDLAEANASLKAANLEISVINEELSQSMGALARANDQLRKANQLKSDFLGIAVHDLSNPLQIIIAYVEMLEAKAQEESLDMPELEFINIAAEKMLQLITRLLETARQDQSEIELSRINMDLSNLVADVIDSRAHMAVKKGQTLERDISQGIMVNGDALLISQVVENLLSNAIKYSPPGKSIFISLHASENYAHFQVRDEGPGLTSDDQKQLFTSFRRLSAKPTGGESSNGLGLSFCKKFIEAHGGRMEVFSRKNQGSSFGFLLPLVHRTVGKAQ